MPQTSPSPSTVEPAKREAEPGGSSGADREGEAAEGASVVDLQPQTGEAAAGFIEASINDRALSATEMHERMAEGARTPVTLARAALETLTTKNRVLHAFISRTDDAAMLAADQSARRWAGQEPRGALDGIPIAVSDNIAMAATITSNGHRTQGIAPDDTDADLVANLRRAGAVIVGKTNIDEGAIGGATDNPHYGRVANPLALSHTSGGSNGGAAAAVAAGIVPMAIATDTLGGLRIPAAYCGLFALRPTFGAIGRTGIRSLAPSFDTVSAVARTAADLRSLFDVLDGYDATDPDSVMPTDRWVPPAPMYKAVVFGVLEPPGTAVESAVRLGLYRAAEALQATGAARNDVIVDGWYPPAARADALAIVEAELAATCGPFVAEDPRRFGEGFMQRIDAGHRISASRLVAAYETRRRMASVLRRAFSEVDVLMLPTTPQMTMSHEAVAADAQIVFAALASLAGLPAVTMPVPRGAGLPTSVQLIGPAWSEPWLLDLAGSISAGLSGPD